MGTEAMSRCIFMLYDAGYCESRWPCDRAALEVCSTLESAIRATERFGKCAIYSYTDDHDILADERWECDALGGERLAAKDAS